MILVYDKSFEGFLTLVYEVYYEKIKPSMILKELPNSLILDELREVYTDEIKASKVLKAIKEKFPVQSFQTILNVFLCDSKEFELDLLYFIILGFKDTNELFNINNSYVFRLQNLEKELLHINHKMTGFVRFQELEDDTLYAKIETKYNLVYLLGQHFYPRLNNQRYIIHDLNRKLAFIKDENFIGIRSIASFEEPTLSKNEAKFKKLWCEFFETVSIESRKNEKCQQTHVPLLYRTYMTEFEKV